MQLTYKMAMELNLDLIINNMLQNQPPQSSAMTIEALYTCYSFSNSTSIFLAILDLQLKVKVFLIALYLG